MLLLAIVVSFNTVASSEKHRVVVLNGSVNYGIFENNKKTLNALIQQTVTSIALQNNLKVVTWDSSYGACEKSFCGYQNADRLNDALLEQGSKPSISLLVHVNDLSSVGIQAIDLLSREIVSSITLDLPKELLTRPTQNQYTVALERVVSDVGLLVIQQIRNSKHLYKFELSFVDLTQTETQALQANLNTLGERVDSDIDLIRSEVVSAWLTDNWFLLFDSTFSVTTSISPTEFWQLLVPITEKSALSMTFNDSNITVSRKGTAFLFQKILISVVTVASVYLIINYLWWQFMSARLQVLSAQNRVSKWLSIYHLWHYSPFVLPQVIKTQAYDIKQQKKLCDQYSLEIQKAIDSQRWQQANDWLSQLKTIDREHWEIFELEQVISNGIHSENSLSLNTSQVKLSLSSAVNALSQGSIYHAYYYCHSAKKQCNSTQYQELAAIDKLLVKVSKAVTDRLLKQDINTHAELRVVSQNISTGISTKLANLNYVLSNKKRIQLGRGHQALSDSSAYLPDTCFFQIKHSAVSSFHKHLLISKEHGEFFCSDLGSKNGTWLNQSFLDERLTPILQNDTISLSAKQGATPVQFLISTDKVNQSLLLQLDKANVSLFDKGQLTSIWRNFNEIESTDFWLVGEGIYVCFDDTEGLYLCHLYQLSNVDLVIAKIIHDGAWHIVPDENEQLIESLYINDALLVGKVCLESNVSIRYRHATLTFKYDTHQKLTESDHA